MSDPASLNLPYAPTLCDMPARDVDQLKRSLDGIVTPGELSLAADSITGDLRACRLTGGGVLATVRLGHQEVRHDSAHLRKLTGDDVIVLLALDGNGTVTQQGHTLPFGKGDITFRRARLPSIARIDEPANLVMLRLPISRFMGEATSRHASFRPFRADAGSGIVRTIHCFADAVLPSFATMSPAMVAAAEASLVSLLSAAYLEATDGLPDALRGDVSPRANRLRWSQLSAYIAANLCDPELDVASCADAIGVSKRYVHTLFGSMGMQYGRYVLQQRLARCRDDLLHPLCRTLSIERIAYRNGFNDAAHFSRSFRAAFGVSPRAFRDREAKPAL